MKLGFEYDRTWSMKVQQEIAIPILEGLFKCQVVSKDITDPEWDRQSIDKILKRADGRTVLMGVRFRTYDTRKGSPRNFPINVTIRYERPKGSTEYQKLNQRYNFYGVTDAPSNRIAATEFLWAVIYRADLLRDWIEEGRMQEGGDLYDKYPHKGYWHPGFEVNQNEDGSSKWIDIPIRALREEGLLVAMYIKGKGWEITQPSADLHGGSIQLSLGDFT